MGSKNRHSKELLNIMLADRKYDQWWVEPFVGGFNIINKVEGKRLANDINPYLIALFRAIQTGWIPPDNISENEYKDIKENKEKYPLELVGFVGFGCSFGGKWWGGYARGNDVNGQPRNYCLESKKNILKQVPKINGVIITYQEYYDLKIPDNSIIYCDPPYWGTTGYKNKFDHVFFWDWVRNLSTIGHSVFVSEYSAPDDFKCIWEKKVNNTLVKETGSKQGIERLFYKKI
jgi:DNA adenine methylase